MQRSISYRPPLPRRVQATHAPGTPDRCPLLGTTADPGTSLSFPSDANYCHSTRLSVPISTIHQENFCLSPNYENCPVFRQHNAVKQESTFLPVAAMAVAGVDDDNDDDPWAPTADVAPVAPAMSGASGMAAATARPPASPLSFPWEEPAHPDFQADVAAATARRDARRGSTRPIWVSLLLLALIPLAWWLWTNARPGARDASEEAGGTIVTLPTLMATSETEASAPGGAAVADAGAMATPSPVAGAGGEAQATPLPLPTAEPTATASDLERIAATATALFAAATPVTECVAPSWWVTYSVEAGDTIEGLAAMRGIRPEELIVANCLAGPELQPGMLLWLPPVGVIVVRPGQATTTATVAATPPRRPVQPTRAPFPFPTPTFPVVIIIPTMAPTRTPADESPTDEPPTRQPTRPPVQPTATLPGVSTTATATVPVIFPTSTPPPFGPTQTPPGVEPTVTATLPPIP